MLAEQSVRDGKLDDALAQLEKAVRDDPANPKFRVFLFQLLSVQGNWDRALTQLAVLQDMDVAMLPLVFLYRDAIQSEAFRSQVFAGQRKPLIFGEPEQWLALLLESLAALAQGRDNEAERLREQALELAPATRGALTCQESEPVEFAWIADADSRLGPVLEVVMEGKYFWVPFQRIASVQFDPPEDLRDLVWLPAHFRWTNGGETAGLVPVRYVGSEQSADPQVRLSRMTAWDGPADGICYGLGQRMLATDSDDFALLQIRQIEVQPQE